jgi:AraC family transcriptional regulator
MRSFSRLPETAPLEQAPTWPLSLDAPPTVRWFGVGRHGQRPVEEYRFPGLWSLHLYRWTGALTVEGVSLPVRPGYASLVPLGATISHHFTGPSVHLSAGFAPPVPSAETGSVHLPAMMDLGAAFGPLWERMEKGVAAFGARPARAAALLWEMLWELAERTPVRAPEAAAAGDPPVVRRAREIIELRLSEPLRVADLADVLNLSHNHLTRLFREATGQSVIGYIRERRVARARQMLEYSTVPVKVIAAQVGLPDLHQFNKTVRAVAGQSPRELRRRSGDGGSFSGENISGAGSGNAR